MSADRDPDPPSPTAVHQQHNGGPLSAVRVIDLSSVVMGPYATQLMADMGADIICIEAAGGDINRRMGTGPHPDLSGVSLNLLRNKRNVGIDLKSEAGHAVMVDLIRSADVFLTNLRPGPLGRLRLNYEDLRGINQGLVYCTAQGFPRDGTRGDDPAFDDIMQAETGLVDAMRRGTGTPALVPSLLADKVSGLSLAFAVTAALLERSRTGHGRRVDLAMSEAVKSFLLVEHGGAAVVEDLKGPVGYGRILTRARQAQPTADGWICIFPYHRRHYDDLAQIRIGLGGSGWSAQDTANPDSLYELLRSVTPTRTTDEWMAWCREKGIPAAPVATLEELVEELPLASHPVAGPYRVTPKPARIEGNPDHPPRPAPLIGEHNRSVLSEMGYPSAVIDRLESGGVLWSRR